MKSGKLARGRKDPAEPVAYTSRAPTTAWSRLMREWPKFATGDHTTGHVIRYLPRDYKIFQLMDEGWQYPEVWRFEAQRQQYWWLVAGIALPRYADNRLRQSASRSRPDGRVITLA